MKINYTVAQQFIAHFLLIGLCLQSCNGKLNLPIKEEEPSETIELEEQGRRKRVRIETEESQQQRETVQEINALDIFSAEVWQDVYSYLNFIESQHGTHQSSADQQEFSNFDILPVELCQYIFSYLDYSAVLKARSVSADWNELIIGFRQPGVIGVENKPSHIINTGGWTIDKELDFKNNNKLKKLTPKTTPSFFFYRLIGKVRYLPQEFWAHLQDTHVHTVSFINKGVSLNEFYSGEISATEAVELAKNLQGTKVHTINLGWNQIGATGIEEFARSLQGTHVEAIYLPYNNIKDMGAKSFAESLHGTSVHTVNLALNNITDEGILKFAKHLQGTKIRTVSLKGNPIGFATLYLLGRNYPEINWLS